eukprot:TRINITY_DN2990_c0_g1_i1.p1 TRINITY_DN2990_c0_g1~~TRINITY_DN2990_c0_g1_i1.p1  ORF type:complete len:528 (-),score=83.03 TRINITY_DN2990_c0_g1_i1:132-1715(-)
MPVGPDNLVCAMANGTLVNYNLDTLEIDSYFSNCTRPIGHLAVSEGIAAVSEWVPASERATVQPTVHLWDAQATDLTPPTAVSVGAPVDCLSLGKKRMAVGSGQSTTVWDVAASTRLGTFAQGDKPGQDDVVDALFHDGNSLLTLSLDSNVKLFDIRAGQAVLDLTHQIPSSWSIVDSATIGRGVDGQGLRLMANHQRSQLGVMLRSGVIDIWDVRILQRPQHTLRDSLFRPPDPRDPMHATVGRNSMNGYMVWDVDFERIVSSFNNRLRCWSSNTGEQLFGTQAHADMIDNLCLLSSHHVATGSADKAVTVWDLDTAEPCYTLIGHADRVHHVVRAGSFDKLVSIDAESSMRVWDFSFANASGEQSSMSLASLYRAKLSGEADVVTSMQGSDKPGIAIGASMHLLCKAFDSPPTPAAPDVKTDADPSASHASSSPTEPSLTPVWLDICQGAKLDASAAKGDPNLQTDTQTGAQANAQANSNICAPDSALVKGANAEHNGVSNGIAETGKESIKPEANDREPAVTQD